MPPTQSPFQHLRARLLHPSNRLNSTISTLNRQLATSRLSTPLLTLRHALRHESTTTTSAPQSALAKLWHSPVGPKTVHFWAPIAKWGVVLAGVSDFFRPVETVSLQQNLALMATGAIWTRWCFVIRPQNFFLATVNFFLFCNGATQTGRVLAYRSRQSQDSVGAEAVKAAKEEGGAIKGLAENPQAAVKKAERV